MMIKKLAVPLVNEKLLQQAEHCYIATAGISSAGFDFIRTRLSPKCKIDIVTGLDAPTSPDVLQRVWKHYQGRISFQIYTKNFFHANLYIFDLPFRKSVAFVGSGTFSLEGLKDQEELFYKVTDFKEIEALKSWYTSYFEFSEPLNEAMIAEYELLYPTLKQREIASRKEKAVVIAMTTRSFSWDTIKFKNQYFKKEDFMVFSYSNSISTSEERQAGRERIAERMKHLYDGAKGPLAVQKIHSLEETSDTSLNVELLLHPVGNVKSMALAFGRRPQEIAQHAGKTLWDFITLQICLSQKEFSVLLVPGMAGKGRVDREYFSQRMGEAEYRTSFFKLVTSLGTGYWIEIVGDRKAAEAFQSEELLWEFIKGDDWRFYEFIIGKDFSPGDPAISSDHIGSTIDKEMNRLAPLYHHMKSPS